MSLVLEFLRVFIGDLNKDRAFKGQVFIVKNPAKFADVVFCSRALKDDKTLSSLLKNVDFAAYNNGTVCCLGKGGGGHPQFQIWPDEGVAKHVKEITGEEPPVIIVSTSFKATGNPENYGLSGALTRDEAELAMAHRIPYGQKSSFKPTPEWQEPMMF